MERILGPRCECECSGRGQEEEGGSRKLHGEYLDAFTFAEDILSLMGASAAVVKEGAIFTRIMFGGSLAIMLLFLINGIFRGAGDAAMAMKSLWIASLVNIILCPILIHYMV